MIQIGGVNTTFCHEEGILFKSIGVRGRCDFPEQSRFEKHFVSARVFGSMVSFKCQFVCLSAGFASLSALLSDSSAGWGLLAPILDRKEGRKALKSRAPILKKNALGVKRPFSEQLSEFRGILGATLGMALMT